MTSALVVGSTGLVGSNILSILLSHPSISSVRTLSRRVPKASAPQLESIVEPTSTAWPSLVSSLTSPPSLFISALGTTRAQAGSAEAQRKIDYDLNLDLAKAALTVGVRVYVLISSASTRLSLLTPYGRMKAELERDVQALGFEHAVIIKPGILMGSREDLRIPEAIARGLVHTADAVSGGCLKDTWAQDADVVARAAVAAGLHALDGQSAAPEVWFVEQPDVLRLGRTEWKA